MHEVTQPLPSAADGGHMDPLTNLLWLLALQLAAGRDVRLDLSTWPTSYRAAARA